MAKILHEKKYLRLRLTNVHEFLFKKASVLKLSASKARIQNICTERIRFDYRN